MNTFTEFLAKRDTSLLKEYVEYANKMILEAEQTGEAPAQLPWWRKWGQNAMKVAAPLTAGLMLAGGVSSKAHAAPQDPSQGQKAPTSQTMKPDAKNPMQNNMIPMQQSNYNSNFKAELQDFAKKNLKINKIDLGNGQTIDDVSIGNNMHFGDLNHMGDHKFDMGSNLTGQDIIKIIQDIKDTIPTSFTKNNDNMISFLTNKLITKAMHQIKDKSVTPQQAKTILQHWTNPIESNGQVLKTNQSFEQLQQIAQGK